MGTPVKPIPQKKDAPKINGDAVSALHPAAVNAAAASFAGLISKLDYLSPEDLEKVRQAYRFADEAHLGQLRNSGGVLSGA